MPTFLQKKITVDLIKPVIKHQWEKAVAAQCGAEIYQEKMFIGFVRFAELALAFLPSHHLP